MFFVCLRDLLVFLFFFFNDTATTEIYTLSLHDALPISPAAEVPYLVEDLVNWVNSDEVKEVHPILKAGIIHYELARIHPRSEEHTSELQSPCNLVCRLLLEKKKNGECHLVYCFCTAKCA